MKLRSFCWATSLGLLITPAVSLAHGGFGTSELLYDGILHVLLAIQYLFTIAASALLVSQSKQRDAIFALAQPLIGAGIGVAALLAIVAPGWSDIGYVNRLFMISLGIMVASALAIPKYLLLTIIALAGLLTGLELFMNEPPGESQLAFVIGAILGGMIAHGAVGGIVIRADRYWSRIAVRIAGSWIAATGILFVSFMLAAQ